MWHYNCAIKWAIWAIQSGFQVSLFAMIGLARLQSIAILLIGLSIVAAVRMVSAAIRVRLWMNCPGWGADHSQEPPKVRHRA
jgi:hypothetical protein